jgi:hypothetical protein
MGAGRVQFKNKLVATPIRDWSTEVEEELRKAYQADFEAFEKYISAAEFPPNQKSVFVKEHIVPMMDPVILSKFRYGEESTETPLFSVGISNDSLESPPHSPLNVTILPDEFLKTWSPTFLIRHPALTFPSNYRSLNKAAKIAVPAWGERDFMKTVMTFKWTRMLYEFFLAQKDSTDQVWPIILDGDDVVSRPDLITRWAVLMGMDPTKLVFSWAASTEKEDPDEPNLSNMFLSTLLASSGINSANTSANIDIGTEAEKWKHEFGEEDGKMIEGYVREALPDYEYLKARRFGASENSN